MLNQLAYYLREQASYKDAEKYFQQALRMSEQFGLESYRDTVINNLARLYFDTYRYTKASPLYEQALAMREQKLGSEDTAIAGALNRLALTYWYEGNNGEKSKYTQAETLYERALRISTQKLGAEHNDTLLILNNQALLYRSLGRYEEAIKLNLHVLGIRRRKDPPVPLEVAQSLQNLAVTYYEQGDQSKYEEEELLLKEALAIREKRLPPKHLQIARCLRYLGLVYQAQEKYNETPPLFKRALDIFDEQLGKEMPETISLARNYHALLLKLTPEPKEEIARIETRYQVFNLDDDGDVAG
jgi:tetratricopeptide (TPR) repeat protein